MNEKSAYVELAEKLSAPTSERFLKILDAMFTPEEAKICLEFSSPATCQELASRLNIDEKSLATKLGNLVDRGILTRGKTQYAFHTSLLAFHHDIADAGPHTGPHALTQEVKDLWGDFFRNEWCDIFVDGYIQRQQATGRQVHHVWPAIGALELSPNIRPEDILPEENFRLTIENAKRRIIAPCGCRVLWAVCDHPLMTCFACFDNPRGEYYIDKPGRLLKEYSLDETLAIVRANEESGLVHIGVCFCCTCCCEILYSLTRAQRYDLLAPSRYLATVNEELCTGCQDCIDKCPFDAVEMRQVPGSKKLKTSIIAEKCMGCGVCIVGCEQKALRYEIVRPPEHVTSRQFRPPTPPADGPTRRAPGGGWGYYNLE